MYLLGYSLNNLTLMALTIATGFVVDDAIVTIENITRYLEKGEKPLVAALKGAQQIGFTIISLTVSLVAVLRSEEHTSELQSLMRISYAVFCLKKNTNKQSHSNTTTDNPNNN